MIRTTLQGRRWTTWLPEGRQLPDGVWSRRHGIIVRLALLQAVALAVFGTVVHAGVLTVLVVLVVVTAPLILAVPPIRSRKVASGAASVSLFLASAALVHLWDGRIEAHFHFFVMVGVVALYQDWIPFGIGLAIVVLHHGVLGTVLPAAVFSHEEAHRHPWRWMLVHAGFVLAASAAHLASWRLNEQQAHSDPSTGLATRARFLDVVATALSRRYPVSVVVVALEEDEDLLAHHGSGAAEELRRAVTDRLRACVRPDDVVAHLGGSRFALATTAGPAPAATLAAQVRAALTDPVTVGRAGSTVALSAVVGVAHRDTLGEGGGADLLRHAELAAAWARTHDRGAPAVHTEGMSRFADDRVGLRADLDAALAAGEFRLFYQPVVALGEARAERGPSYEALLRWEHPVRGLVSPAEFVPLLEADGGIVAVGSWVLCEATAQAARWTAQQGRPVGVAVNLSARQLADDAVLDVVADALLAAGLPPEQLTLEVTETMIMDDLEAVADRLARVRATRVRVAIDDFGTGHSSLAYLRSLPVDTVKLDRSFVNDVAVSAPARMMAASVVELTRSLGLSLVAEGVETSAQARVLEELGCRSAQGYLYGRPAPADRPAPEPRTAPDTVRSSAAPAAGSVTGVALAAGLVAEMVAEPSTALPE